MSEALSPNECLVQSDLLMRVRRTLRGHEMVRRGETIIVGVSGGVDSMCLLDVLVGFRESYALQLIVAHLHHGLRGEEADQDLCFVEQEAARYGLSFEAKRLNPEDYVRGDNIQTQARAFRYAFLEEVASKWNAQKIATGHHQDDQVETLLLQLFRGTGSLTGIHPVRNGRIIRPLLEVGRSDIMAYADERGFSYRVDSSNAKRTYLRNRIRQELIPWIRREVNHDFSKSLIRFSSILQEDKRCLDRLAKQCLVEACNDDRVPDRLSFSRERLLSLEKAITVRIIRESYHLIAGTTKRLSHKNVENILELIPRKGEKAHKKICLPRGVQVYLEYDHLQMSRSDPWTCPAYEYPVLLDEERFIPEARMRILATVIPCERVRKEEVCDLSIAYLALGTAESCRMVVRNFRPGDRFSPAGMGGTKKLKDFFIDQKVPKSRRYRLPILFINGRIAWVVGQRVDERYRVTQQWNRCIKVEASCEEQES